MSNHGQAGEPGGPDLSAGVPLEAFRDRSMLTGHVAGEEVVLVATSAGYRAVSAQCTHYGGPLAEGLVVDETIRCPWHHACFSLRTGAVLGAPALEPLRCWQTEVEGDVVRVGPELSPPPPARLVDTSRGPIPHDIVVVGAGAAGSMAVRTLRAEGYGGRLVLVDPEPDAPYDRPNLSKDYLAGNAPEEWLPLWPADWVREHDVERIQARAQKLDAGSQRLVLEDGRALSWDALLLATGARPIRPPLPGAEQPHVHVLRSLADSRALRGLPSGSRVVIAGASFIGMEAAAALRAHDVAVTIVAPEAVPFAKVLGEELGGFLAELHAAHGVAFRLGRTLARIAASAVELDDGTTLPADAVLLGIGVRPHVPFADVFAAGGIAVNDRLESRIPRVYAAGDIARYPHPLTREPIRIEHWVVAERQGACAARNLLGADEPFTDVPFFWTRQYDVTVAYTGHAIGWDRAERDGDPAARDFQVNYYRGNTLLAQATVGRDLVSLRTEAAFAAEYRNAARQASASSTDQRSAPHPHRTAEV